MDVDDDVERVIVVERASAEGLSSIVVRERVALPVPVRGLTLSQEGTSATFHDSPSVAETLAVALPSLFKVTLVGLTLRVGVFS